MRDILAWAGDELPPTDLLDELRGHVCGVVTVTGAVPLSELTDNPLALGPQGWLLEAPEWFNPIAPAAGKLRL